MTHVLAYIIRKIPFQHNIDVFPQKIVETSGLLIFFRKSIWVSIMWSVIDICQLMFCRKGSPFILKMVSEVPFKRTYNGQTYTRPLVSHSLHSPLGRQLKSWFGLGKSCTYTQTWYSLLPRFYRTIFKRGVAGQFNCIGNYRLIWPNNHHNLTTLFRKTGRGCPHV